MLKVNLPKRKYCCTDSIILKNNFSTDNDSHEKRKGVGGGKVLVDNSVEQSDTTETSAPSKLKSVKCVKAPLPELVPIEPAPASPVDSGGSGRSVRQAALISAEKTKMMSRMERFSTSTASPNEKIKVAADLMNGGTVSVEKRSGSSIEHCHQCKKVKVDHCSSI